jgi:hypothetical protein
MKMRPSPSCRSGYRPTLPTLVAAKVEVLGAAVARLETGVGLVAASLEVGVRSARVDGAVEPEVAQAVVRKPARGHACTDLSPSAVERSG